MKIKFYGSKKDLKLALIIDKNTFSKSEVEQYYVSNIKDCTINNLLILLVPSKMKTVESREMLINNIYPILEHYNIDTVVMANASLFKIATGITASEGYMKINTNLAIENKYKSAFKIIPVVNYSAFFYNSSLEYKLGAYLSVVSKALENLPANSENNINKHIESNPKKIKKILKSLLKYKKLAVDIESFSLEHWKAGIGTISFSPSITEAFAFYVDYLPKKDKKRFYAQFCALEKYPEVGAVRIKNKTVYDLLHWFFEKYKGTLIIHNIGYDIRILIYVLFMKHMSDRKGLLKGIKSFQKLEDTQILTFMAINNCDEFKVDLKSNTIEYMGNYGIDVKDITTQKPKKLINYNCDDTVATMFLYGKYKDIPVKQDQKYLYWVLLQGAMLFVDIQLTGMPIDVYETEKLENKLTKYVNELNNKLKTNKVISLFNYFITVINVTKSNLKNKLKFKTLWDVEIEEFNPGSNTQLTELLHNFYDVPVLQKTKKGNPSTDKKTMDMYINLVTNSTKKEWIDLRSILKIIKSLNQVSKILNTFVPAFKKYSIKTPEGYRLFGKFKFPSTRSFRPTSNNPNLLQIPSTGSMYAKPVKKCFKAPKGRIMLGADYAAMEHRVNALLTRDPNMLAEYVSGLDGHAARSYRYFKEELRKLDPELVANIEFAEKWKDKKKYYINEKGEYIHE